MFNVAKLVGNRNLLANVLFAGGVLLLPMQNAFALPTIGLSTSFSPADGTRTYMDIGGTWNGTTEVNTGDGFTLSVSNTGPDPAYDIRDIPVIVPAGFVLASGTVTVTDNGCTNMNANASQGSAGTPVTINIFSNNSTSINPGCTYNYTFRLETNTTAAAGTQSLDYTVRYNTINNDNGSIATTVDTQNIDVNAGGLGITKSTPVVSAITGDVISYNITVSSTGSGGLFDVQLNDVLSSDLNGLTFNVPDPPPGANGPGADDYTFEYLAAGEVVNLTVDATVTPANTCPVLQNSANLSERTGTATDAVGPVSVQYDFQFTSGLPTSVVTHNATSFCEFCGDGTVSLTVQNPTGAPLTNITIVEDLQASGLEYINNSTTVTSGSAANPAIAGSQLTWTSAQLSALANLAGGSSFVITFGVRSTVAENLITADRNILATADFDMSCLAARQSIDTGQFELPIQQPQPNVLKDGRNYDAGQGGYSDPIYGNLNDDVIWRVNVQNVGLANMQALRMNDSINGNFNIGSICPDEGSAVATAAANGTPAPSCIPMTSPFNVVDPFGNAADPDDIAAGTNTAFVYYVGRVLGAHTNNTNSSDISWGCAVDSPTGGLITVPASTGGSPPAVVIAETGDLSTTVVPAGLQITQTVTGSNPAQPLGSKGLVTVTINNQTGGSIKNIELQNVVPNGYVVDGTYGSQAAPADCDCTVTYTPAYGATGDTYPGFIDTVDRIDTDRDDGDPLNDLSPRFRFTSSASSNIGAELNQRQILRNGDIVTLTFGIVMVDPLRFDLVADLDVAPENTADGTDPTNALALTSSAAVDFDAADAAGVQNQTRNDVLNFNADPEDIDVAISDALFILTNDPGTPLDLNVLLTNNGGHDADDYTAYITLGQAMTAQLPYPAGCVATSNLPPHPTWNQPAPIPNTAAVFACDRGVIAPGATETITFTVIKAPASPVPDDDLTFRVDVTGEVTLFDGNALTFPTPPILPNTDPAATPQLANNYTLDAIRSRVLGFNLVKSAWYCAEDGLPEPAVPPADILSPAPGAPNTPPLTGNLNSQIGEDCSYRIESGGWFGFLTPGFTLIAVENVAVTDDLPDGQGFIPFGGSPFNYTSTPGISLVGANGGAGTTPLSENDITWNFNATGSGIIIKDRFFRVDFKTRLLNDPVDLDYPVPGGYAPNLHGNLSTNIARTSFDAVFNSASGNVTISVDDASGVPGYPVPAVRTVDLTDVEPNLIVTKQVCNETLSIDAGNGAGENCTPFLDTVNNGDTNDLYVYRVTLTNETTVPIRSPAYNVISTDTLDASGLMLVTDFTTDGLDNDDDGFIDALDLNGEGTITGNTVGVPAVITIDDSHSASLLQVDSGDTVEFYYRVDPHITIAPLQSLTNRVSMKYDSLEGAFGNQNVPQHDNLSPALSGRARIYTTIEQTANVVMIPVVALPKLVTAKSNTPILGAPHDVSVGEEVRYLLVADLPVANLRQFKIRDELPPGVRCIEEQIVDLDAFPYSLAGFSPGGVATSTCTSTGVNDFVEWNFGDQAVTLGSPGTRFNFPITFVARVENTAITTDGAVLTNGGGTVNPVTCTGGVGVCYVDDMNNAVSLDFAPIDIVVREPIVTLTKSFLPVVNSDAADVLTVTVTATNIQTTPAGIASAYNLQVLDDLVGSDMTYVVGSEGGPNQPDNVDTSVPNRPVFSWNIANPDYEILTGAGNAKTFTFQVRVDTTAQPLELLDNTLQAKWDSLPDQNVALNSSGSIGPDGSVLGLRNGAVPNAGNAINDYETTATASTSVLPLTMTKTDLDPTVVPTIGAHRNFEVVINLPEGTTENLIIDDALVFGGVSYALSRNGSFDVSYTFEDIISINGLPPAEAVFRGATAGPPTLPVDGDTGTITWDIGQIITDEEDDYDGVANAVNPRIIINYYARPNNDAATNDGVNVQNSATVTYDNGETAAPETLNDTTAVQTVVEPLLAISKAVSNITNPTVGPVAGDVLEYQVTINNTGNSTAFDSNIVDTLDANLLFDASFTPTALLNGVAVPGFVATPAGAPAGPLIWGRGNTPIDNTLDIPVGETLVLTYRTVAQTTIQPNLVISNSALVDWTSLDDTDPSNAFERTGAGCPAITAPNDYCSAPAVANITVDDRNNIIKTVIFDTYDEPPLSNATDSIVRIGDTVTYQLDINLQEGTTSSINILDAVPAGMEFVDVVGINGATTAPYAPPASGAGSNFSYAPIPAGNVPAAGNTLIFNWNLGTIANDVAGDATTDTLVIIYRARVVDNVPTTIAQQPTTTLTNTADFTYIDGVGNPSPADPRLNDSADIFVLQPVMDALSKTDRLGRPTGITVNVATDVMEFRLHSCNTTGLARAYGLLMTDTLPAQLDETSLIGPTNGALAPDVLINGVLAIAGTDYVYTPPAARGGNMVFRFNTPVDPGVCVDIDFNMGFYTDFPANQSWSNTVAVDEYYSMPPADAQLYSIVLPETFDMNNLGTTFPPPEKTMVTPAPALPEATIGDEVIYQILVPETPANAVMYDVTITDTLANSLLYVSASDIGPSGFVITDNTVLPGDVNLVIPQIPAGQQAVIELRARVDNTVNANAGNSFVNTVEYRFANAPAVLPLILGGTDTTATTLTVIEPVLAVAKTVANITKPGIAPDAGDILRYTVTLTASGGAAPGDLFADAFDVSLDDSLSLGLLYNGNETVNGGNTINAPVIVGDGVTTPQSLSWSLAQANADIDVVEGTVVTVNYDVLVLDSTLANQNLSNSVDIQWSSRDGPDVNERDGSGVPLHNDYFNLVSATTLQTTPDNNVITKTRLSDTYNPADNIVRIGDIVDYELRINMQEGTSANFVVQDNLPQGLAFEQTVSINGQTVAPYPAVAPFTHNAIPAAVIAGDPTTGPTTVSWNAGDVINAGDNNITNDDFVIVYRARVLNLVHPQVNNIALPNTVNLDYDMAIGAAPTKTGNQLIDLQQPDLSLTKTSVPVDGSIIGFNDLVTYTIEITNSGTTPAYDTELHDTIPFGLRSPAITMMTMQLLSGTPLPGVLPPVYNPATGLAIWNFDTGTADQYNIPAGDTLQIVYQVQADAGLGTGLIMTNQAQVQFYYSFDNDATPSVGGINGVREIYGPSNLDQVTLTTTPANPLLKANPADLDVSIGESFTYTITVPETIQPSALYDVQIQDNLNLSAADLMFTSVSRVSGTQPWTPVNIGTVADDLVIADITNGIDIPANQQIVIAVTVTLRDSLPPNDTNLTFSNAATYTFNQVNGDNGTVSNGSGNTTPLMNVVEPDLTLVKTGPAGTVNFTAPIPYTVVVENIGDGPAFDTTIVDQLPDVPDNTPLTGGTCDASPINIVVDIFENDGTTPARPAPPLLLGTDYSVTYTAAPTCELVITTLSDKARIEASEKLIVTYEATLNVGTQSGAELTNIAGATQWYSLDTAGAGATGEIREYTEIITDGTPTVTDHQDAFMVTVEAPVLDVQKTVMNVTTGQNPGDNATPGDVLRYTITISNGGLVDAAVMTLSDAIPANATYIADTVTLNGLPVGQPDGGVSPLIAGIDVSSSDLPPPTPDNGTITVGETATVTFDVLLNPVITSGTVISNQAFADSPSTGPLPSDDPVAPGAADPTTTLITSAPAFLVQKTSMDVTGDPAILMPGDTLRYTLTVKNIGLENSINSMLSDQVPANTTYVANSTRLNTVVVPDPAAGISPLAAGMLINAPENTTAGFLRADTNVAADNVATITFDVVVSLTAVNGTILSNQGFFNGAGVGSGVFPQQPSDDPDTALVNDPTIDVVGNVPVVDSLKTVDIAVDVNGNGLVDPGDTLRYTITTTNIGALPATNVVFTDDVPANTTYVPNSTTLNTLAVPDPGVGVSPLVAGIAMSSSDLPPPTPGNGVLSPGGTAVVVFDVQVGTVTVPLPPAGTIISNQGLVSSNELPTEPTDADGNDANGDQPTETVVGDSQRLAITKQVSVVGGGAAEPGIELEYVVQVSNIGSVTATNVVIASNLELPDSGQVTYVTGSGLLDGLATGVSLVGSTVTVNYGDMPASAMTELRFRVLINLSLVIGDTIVKTTDATWNSPSETVSATVSIDIGGIPGSAILNGQVWHDADFNNDVGTDEPLLQDYRVEVYRNNILLANTLTDANGVFAFSGLPPNTIADPYEVRYYAPGATATTASLGTANSVFTNRPQRILDIIAASGDNLQGLNLPRQANGIVYDSVLRVPVSGVQLTMINQTRSNQAVPENCFDDPVHANQVTLADGYYKFDLNFSDPARCDRNDEYEIQVQPPADDFTGTTSVIIPPVEPATGAALNVPGCPDTAADKVPATAQHCENSASNVQPPATIAPRSAGTDYHLKFLFSDVLPGTPFTDQIYNNHIPVDGVLEAAVAISKVAGKLNVTRSDLVPYTITFNNTLGVPLFDISVIDNFPAGFKYVAGSARVDGEEIEPEIDGRFLTWSGLSADINESRVIKLLLVVGSGVGEGEYVNTARAINTFTGADISGVASATVRVIPDPTFDCTDVIGKVFDDKNLNAYQDQGERGIPGVQVATARGLRVTTDKHGRFHITCAIVANEVLGSNFIMKLDDRTLPSGYRVTTENPRVQRATRGKMMKFNFGTAIHRVVRLDLADGVFEKNSTELRPQWRSRIDLLITELQKEGSILRLTYLAENESEDEVDDRLDAIEDLVSDRWEDLDCCYKLVIEKEVFWRKGSPSAGREFEE